VTDPQRTGSKEDVDGVAVVVGLPQTSRRWLV
jgi:hypothetical protein